MRSIMEVVVETYRLPGDPPSANLRARPVRGQGIDPATPVECSRSLRNRYPPGTLFTLPCRQEVRDGKMVLHAKSIAGFKLLTPEQAARWTEAADANTWQWRLIV